MNLETPAELITDFGQESDRDHPFVESARALQCYRDIKFPTGEHALREEKHLSKEGSLGSCSVRWSSRS